MKKIIVLFLLFTGLNIYAEVLHLRFATFLPPPHPYSKFLEKVAKNLSDLSNGKVEIRYYGSSSLGKAESLYDVTVEGLADMSLVCNGYTPSLFPISLGVQLPFFADSAESSTEIVLKMLKKGVFNKEYRDVKYLFPLITAPSYIFSRKKITKVKDFKGLRMVGGTKIFKDICKILGASAIVMSYSDVYLALQRGVVDAGVTNWPAAIAGWKWYEVLKYAIDLPIMSGWHCEVLMNKKSWNKVPDNVKKRWEKVFPSISFAFAKFSDKLDKIMRIKAKKEKMDIIEFSKSEKMKLADMLVPVWRQWISSNGKDGVNFYQTYVEIREKLKKPVLVKIPEYLGGK